MRIIIVFISLAVCSYSLYASGIILVDEKYNSGVPENIFQDVKYTITPGQTLTVDWSKYKFKRRLKTNFPVAVILKINDRYNYSASLEQGETKVVLSGENMKPEINTKEFTGYVPGDKIDLTIGFFDLEVESGNRYFISIWSAKVFVE